jgi:molecular chaperone GrpE
MEGTENYQENPVEKIPTDESKEEIVTEENPVENNEVAENVATEPEPELLKEENDADIVERLASIEEDIKRTNDLFESKLLYDTSKEDVITRLHKELQTYKDDMFKKILKPVFMYMIVFADSMRTLGSNYEETPDETALLERYQKLRKEFLKIETHIDDVIYNYGIESFVSKAGDEFNPRTQQVKRDIDAASEDEHKKIVDSLIPGYTWDEQMLRKEGVSVYLYRETK